MNIDLSESQLCEIVELYLVSSSEERVGDIIRYRADEIVVRSPGGKRMANPHLRKELKREVALKPLRLENVTIEQLAEARLGDHGTSGYWLRLEEEFNLLICTKDKKYAELRKKIEREGGKSNTAIVGLISAAVAGTVGVAWGALVPFVALLLLALVRMGSNAYCASVTFDIPVKMPKGSKS